LAYLRPGMEQILDCFRLGGTGTLSMDDHQPLQMPDRYESGNHNGPGLAGLEAGLSYLQARSVADVQHTEEELTRQLVEGLQSIRSVTVYGHAAGIDHVGVVSFTVEGYAPHEVASILDDAFNVQARAGLHCAPGVHRWLGTFDRGGTVRFSVGPFTTTHDVEHAIAGVRAVAES
jgi:cysteine desulfurase / selenocysteine lyase